MTRAQLMMAGALAVAGSVVGCAAPPGADLDPDAAPLGGEPVPGTISADDPLGDSHAIGCSPTPVGRPGVLWVPGPAVAVRHDPVRCLLYVLTQGPSGELVVVDTQAKIEVTRIALGLPGDDLDVAADGSRVVVGHGRDTGFVSVIVPPAWTATRVAAADVESLEVTLDGHVHYFSHSSVYTLDLATGFATRRASAVASFADLELSPDEASLFVGELGTMRGRLVRLAIAGDGSMTRADRSPTGVPADGWLSGVTLSGDGQVVAYGGVLFDSADLRGVRGAVDGAVLALDATGRVGVHGGGVFDAILLRTVASHAQGTLHGALTPSDDEVWLYDRQTDLLRYVNVGDYLGAHVLGQRELAPLPLAAYTFDRLLVDPARPYLYALDGRRDELVVLDRATLAPLQAIRVGTEATDLALDADGQHLWVGHRYTWAIARVDLGTLRVDRWIPTRQFPIQVVALRSDRVAVRGGYVSDPEIDASSDDVALIDTSGQTVLAQTTRSYGSAMIAAADDGHQLYVGDAGSSASCLSVLDTANDRLEVVRTQPWGMCPENYYRGMVKIPSSTDVMWAFGRWRTDDLSRVYQVVDTFVTVTPDGRLAISAQRIYDAATGALLGALPSPSWALAVSPDSSTLYVGRPGRIDTVDLTGY